MNLTEKHHKKKFVEPQPSQDPTDDGEKLGPCNDVPCESFGFDCDECELNPNSPNYEEGWED